MLSSGCRGTWSPTFVGGRGCEMERPLGKTVCSFLYNWAPIRCTFGNLEKWNLRPCKNLWTVVVALVELKLQMTQIAFGGWIDRGVSVLWSPCPSGQRNDWWRNSRDTLGGSSARWKRAHLTRLQYRMIPFTLNAFYCGKKPQNWPS